MNTQKIWENTYCKFGEDLPWCIESIPSWFTKVINSKWVKPCATLDIGCGVGNYSHYLAVKGFNILAIDFSKKVISMAKKKYNSKNLKFKVFDALKINLLNKKFDFVYEVSLLHHISPNTREAYVKGIHSVLNSKGKLLVCCFSDKDPIFNKQKSFFNLETNTIQYPLSEKEIRVLFDKYFKIEVLKKVYFGRKSKRKRERYLCLMERKE
jgi:2-polyprenyl-3-methyl-5-hydroxy-6-metoxy-1,4-benzoquinol methylase